MDIHAPDKPIHSLKEFGIHIAVVTIGILIALSLEGIRELIHDTHLVRETVANFRDELDVDWSHDTDEMKQVQKNDALLSSLVADLPSLMRDHPDQIRVRLSAISNPEYFLVDESWQAALTSGALVHMSPSMLHKYSSAFSGIRIYNTFQREGVAAEARAKVFFDARPTLSPADLSEGAERILLFARAEHAMLQVGTQVHEDLGHALDKPTGK